MKYRFILLCGPLLPLFCTCRKVPQKDYRQEMRSLVQEISAYARSQDPAFIVIPQNGQELLSSNGAADGMADAAYLAAVDGCGREDLFYGYTGDNKATPAAERSYMLGWCKRWRDAGKTVMVTDYCSDPEKMDDSYTQNSQQQFISYAAAERNLDQLPVYPAQPFQANSNSVVQLNQARNFLYLINPGKYASKSAFLQAVQQSGHDIIIMDAFFNEEEFSPVEIESLKTKAGGATRLVIAYMSIGEAENYRYYWKKDWKPGNPSFVYHKNPDWKGNFKVFYWDPAWKAIITGNTASYTQKLLNAGFDGVYLDIIDAFEYYENP